MKSVTKLIVPVVIGLLHSIPATCQLQLSAIFGDSMVLQRNMPIPIWGRASKGERILVSFEGQTRTTRASATGEWMVRLDPVPAGGPYELRVKGKTEIGLKQVLVGEVWICSGQSNMEWTVSASDSAKEENAAANFPMIRHVKVERSTAVTPQKEVKLSSGWKAATKENIAEFTAVGYQFAKELHKKLNVPIGLLNTSWGGTDVETWTSRQAFEESEEFRNMISKIPTLNLDSLSAARRKSVESMIIKAQGSLPQDTYNVEWVSNSDNHARWPVMTVPSLWEQQSLPDFDGTVWFTRTIDLSEQEAAQSAILHLGTIDDNDETYVNGQKVGSTNGYNINRSYPLSKGVLKAGKNVIAVRVDDTGGGGGFTGGDEQLHLQLGSNSKPLAGKWHYNVTSISEATTSVGPNAYPSLLYNAMIHPLIPFAMRGVIWYQGENNAGRAYEYRSSFPLMINDWRDRWKQGDFPFYFVQLASFRASYGTSEKGSTWAELREAQAQTLSLPNTGMAVTVDIGDRDDIHPRNKHDVGKRLAAIALSKDYGLSVPYQGPSFESMTREGNKLIVHFKNVGSGLLAKDRYGYVRGFEVAGADQKFGYAMALIDGDKLTVWSDSIPDPVAVRYAWADDAGDANLYNKDGFPAVPFRSDKWKGVTEGVKYSR